MAYGVRPLRQIDALPEALSLSEPATLALSASLAAIEDGELRQCE
jgi:hypothetical protein